MLVSAWLQASGRLTVASEAGQILREDGDDWKLVRRRTEFSIGPSVAAHGGG